TWARSLTLHSMPQRLGAVPPITCHLLESGAEFAALLNSSSNSRVPLGPLGGGATGVALRDHCCDALPLQLFIHMRVPFVVSAYCTVTQKPVFWLVIVPPLTVNFWAAVPLQV